MSGERLQDLRMKVLRKRVAEKRATRPKIQPDATLRGEAEKAGEAFNTFSENLTDMAVPFKGAVERAATYPAAALSKLTGDKGSISEIADQMYAEGKRRDSAMDEKYPVASTAGSAVGIPAMFAMPNIIPGGKTGGKIGGKIAESLGVGNTAANVITKLGEAGGRIAGVGALSGAQQAIEGNDGAEGATRAAAIQAGIEALPPAWKAATYVGKKVGLPIVKSVSRVPGNFVDKYISRPDQVNSAVDDLYELKNPIDEAVSKYSGAKSQAQNELSEAMRSKEGGRSEIMNRLKAIRPSEEVATGITSELAASGKPIGEQSESAFNAIAGEKISVQGTLDKIKELKSSLKIGGKMPPKSSEEYKAFQKIVELENTIKQQIPKMSTAQKRADELGLDIDEPQIIGKRAKKIVQVLNNMTRSSYDKAAGEFNPIAAGKIKEITKSLNEGLYGVEKYKNAMSGIGDKISARNNMSEMFGDVQQAQSAMIGIANQSPAGMEAKRRIDAYDKAFGTKIWDEIKGYVENKRLQKDPDAIESMLQKFNDEIARKQTNLDQASDTFNKVNRLGVGSTEGAIRTAMRGDPNRGIEGRKALENLGALEGKNYIQDIEDFGTKQAFQKGYPMGSTGTNLGWMLGKAAVGAGAGVALNENDVAGGAIGGLLGAMSDKYGGPAAKRIIDAAMKSDKIMRPLLDAVKRGPAALQVTEALMSRDPEYRRIIEQNK